MSTEIPQWAKERACMLVNEGDPTIAYRVTDVRSGNPAICAFAAYIAEHEEPPVDPLLIEAREIVADWNRQITSHQYAKDVLAGEHDRAGTVICALAALKRGIELAREQSQ